MPVLLGWACGRLAGCAWCGCHVRERLNNGACLSGRRTWWTSLRGRTCARLPSGTPCLIFVIGSLEHAAPDALVRCSLCLNAREQPTGEAIAEFASNEDMQVWMSWAIEQRILEIQWNTLHDFMLGSAVFLEWGHAQICTGFCSRRKEHLSTRIISAIGTSSSSV